MTTDAQPDFQEWSPTERTADFLSFLTYPRDEARRRKLAGALIVLARDNDVELGNRATFCIDALCSIVDRVEVNRICMSAHDIINNKRLIAAYCIWPSVEDKIRANLGIYRPVKVPLPLSREMLDAAHRSIVFANKLRSDLSKRKARGPKPKGDEIEQNADNIKSRVWSDSLPVLHLALALHVELNGGKLAPRPDNTGGSFAKLLLDEHAPLRLFQNATAILPILKELNKIE